MMKKDRRVLIGITGGIAAYKICEVVSTLAKAGVEVRAILTNSAQEFITPLTLATLCRHRAYTDKLFWSENNRRPLHIELGEWADLFVIAPLSAHTLAKLNHGFADNLLTNTVLASPCPILLAPAMNTEMWEQFSVQKNWQELLQNPRYHGMIPGTGILACDRQGMGRLAEPSEILSGIESLLHTQGKRDLIGKKVLITAGGTREYLDPVRFIGNPSTGKMGIALAEAALYRGASVTLIHTLGNLQLKGVKNIPVISAKEMQKALFDEFDQADILLMAAAVGDVKPRDYSPQKLAKKDLPENLPLETIPDLVGELGKRRKSGQILIGFAAQTGDIITPALAKLEQKKLDMIVANPIDQSGVGFGSDQNQGILLTSQGISQEIPICSKLEMAHYIFDFIPNLR